MLCCYVLSAYTAETMHRFRDQRKAGVSLHAEKQELGQVSRLETCRLDAVRILYNGDDRHEHHHTYDEGYCLCSSLTAIIINLSPWHITSVIRSCFIIFFRQLL